VGFECDLLARLNNIIHTSSNRKKTIYDKVDNHNTSYQARHYARYTVVHVSTCNLQIAMLYRYYIIFYNILRSYYLHGLCITALFHCYLSIKTTYAYCLYEKIIKSIVKAVSRCFFFRRLYRVKCQY